MTPETIDKLNHVIQRSYMTWKNSHAWTEMDHALLEDAIRSAEQEVPGTVEMTSEPPFIPARQRGVSMRAFRRFGWERRRRLV